MESSVNVHFYYYNEGYLENKIPEYKYKLHIRINGEL